jgi:hypothetical protein
VEVRGRCVEVRGQCVEGCNEQWIINNY